MRALRLCEGCRRHVRETETACPFCDRPRVAVDPGPVEPAPRGLSRAMLTTLGVGLTVAACQSRSGSSVTETPRVEPHPVIAAPYGAPPPPPTDAAPASPRVRWLITLRDPIAMSARANTPLEISATNDDDAPIMPHRERLTLRVNGQESPAFGLAFGNGVMAPDWERVPAHSVARDSRNMLEAIMPAPGEYLLELFHDGRRVAARRVTVVP